MEEPALSDRHFKPYSDIDVGVRLFERADDLGVQDLQHELHALEILGNLRRSDGLKQVCVPVQHSETGLQLRVVVASEQHDRFVAQRLRCDEEQAHRCVVRNVTVAATHAQGHVHDHIAACFTLQAGVRVWVIDDLLKSCDHLFS